MKLIDSLQFALTGNDTLYLPLFYEFHNLPVIDQEILAAHSLIAINHLYREMMEELYETD